MKYFYYDLCARSGDIDLYEYNDIDEFRDGFLWNRDVAAEYGDKTISRNKVNKLIDSGKEFDWELNGAIFIACNDIKTYEGGIYAN